MTQQNEIKITRTVARIMELIEDYRRSPDETSLLKTACEIDMQARGIDLSCPYDIDIMCQSKDCRDCSIWKKETGQLAFALEQAR